MSEIESDRIVDIFVRKLERIICFACGMLLFTIAMPGIASDVEIKERIDRALPGYVEVSTAPSVSVGIFKDGKVFYERSFGYADKSKEIPATPDTLYGIASITKVFAATLAVILRDEGLVDFDESISAYLPKDVGVPVDSTGEPITLAHLLTHTAGLPANPVNRKNQKIEGLGSFDPTLPDAYDISDLYEALPVTEIKGKVGEKWSYSNYGYQLVGHILERSAGKPFEQLLDDKILRPLGMRDTLVLHDPAQESRYSTPYWKIDRHRTGRPSARFGEVAAAGGLASSVRDMLKFAELQLKQQDRLDDPIALRELWGMREPLALIEEKDELRNQPARAQGFGWRVQSPENGPEIYEHGGALDGHKASLWISPQEGLAIVVLSNSDQAAPAVDDIREWLINVLRQ